MRRGFFIRSLLLGVVLATLSAAVPLLVYQLCKEPAWKPVSPAVRLPDTPSGWPDPNVMYDRSRPGLANVSTIRGIGIDDSWHVERWSAGWPWGMFEGSQHAEIHGASGRPASGVIEPVALYKFVRWGRLWFIPYRVILLAVAGNVTFWSVAAGGGMWLLTAARARRRRRHGRCIACGYPAPTGTRCPECGLLAA